MAYLQISNKGYDFVKSLVSNIFKAKDTQSNNIIDFYSFNTELSN